MSENMCPKRILFTLNKHNSYKQKEKGVIQWPKIHKWKPVCVCIHGICVTQATSL